MTRLARANDASTISALCQVHATYERSSFDAAGHAERLESFLTGPSPRLKVWLATSDGQSIGYAAVTREFSTWRAREYLHLDCLFVVEPFRSQGVGRRLLLAVHKSAQAAGLDEVQWQTPQWNEGAIRFYSPISRAFAKEKIRLDPATPATGQLRWRKLPAPA